MAIKKVRIRPEGENNYADIIHPETSADIVVDTPTKVVMTKEERDKLSGIQAGANKTTIDNTLTSTSTTQALSANQGKVLDNKINNLKALKIHVGNTAPTDTVFWLDTSEDL